MNKFKVESKVTCDVSFGLQVVCVSHHFRHESSLAPSGGGEVVSMIDLGQETAYRRQKSVGAESTATNATAKSSHSDVLLPV